MGWRKGYQGEYLAKKELIECYGIDNVLKIAISQRGFDFMVIGCGEVIKVIEVKTIHNKKKSNFGKRERNQMDRIKSFARQHNVLAELWVYKFFGRGKDAIKQTFIIYNPNK